MGQTSALGGAGALVSFFCDGKVEREKVRNWIGFVQINE